MILLLLLLLLRLATGTWFLFCLADSCSPRDQASFSWKVAEHVTRRH